MLFCLFSILLFFPLVMGWGRLLPALFPFMEIKNPLLFFWCGFGLANVVLQALSFFAPMNGIALAFFALAGLAGLALFRKNSGGYDKIDACDSKIVGILALLLLLCIAYTQADAAWTGRSFDTDFYHAAIISWNNAFPAVPGLAQLNVRLGTDSAFLLLSSIFDNFIWDGRSSFFVNAMFTFAAFMYFIWEAARQERPQWARGFALCILFWLILEASYAIPGLYQDVPTHIINAVLVFEALRLCLEERRPGIGGPFLLCLLAATGFCTKSLVAMSVLFATALALHLLWKDGLINAKNLALVFMLPFLAACGYIGRNIIHSGYPLYPSPFLRINLPWTLPDYIINDIYEITRNHARMRNDSWRLVSEHGFWFWFPGWLARQIDGTRNIRVALTVFAPMLTLYFWPRLLRGPRARMAMFFLAWGLSNMVFWFAMAPETRYATGFPWVLTGTLAALLLHERERRASEAAAPPLPPLPEKERPAPKAAISSLLTRIWFKKALAEKLLFLFGVIYFACAVVNILYYDDRRVSLWGVGPVTSKPVEIRVLKNGQNPPLTVWAPLQGNQCGNAPLPCTPYPEDNLKLLSPGHLEGGFYRDEGISDKHRKHIIPF